ncbi:MAG: phosphatase PAP2 family protein [Pseudomonadota bacterium]
MQQKHSDGDIRPNWIRRVFGRINLGAFLVVLLVLAAVSRFVPEKIGDNYQIALPLIGLGCAVAEGQGVRYFGRYLLLETFIKGPKYGLGDAEINKRPNGNDKGFPSGHTAAAAFGATALVQTCLKHSKTAQAAAILGAGFVGASRIEAGKHTIWQVLAGAVIGWLVQALSLVAFDRLVRRAWDGASIRLRRIGKSAYAALVTGDPPT